MISFATASKLYQKGLYLKSLEILNKLVDTQQDAKTYVLLAKNLVRLGFKAEAAAAYSLAGKLGGQAESLYTREAAILYFQSGNEQQALAHALRLMKVAQDDADLAAVLVSIYINQGRIDLISPFRRVISESANPEHVPLALKSLTNNVLDPTNDALVANLLKKFPQLPAIRLMNLVFARETCDYGRVATLFGPIAHMIEKHDFEFLEKDNPFYHLHWCGHEAMNARASLNPFLSLPELAAKRRAQPHVWGKKIRIGYLSSDFWSDHATMKLLGRVLELHDRDRFEVTLLCHSPETYLETNNKVDRSVWGNLCIVRELTNAEAVQKIRALEIDILVDLKGHTLDGRPDILNHGAAPIQVSWLGFPGSTVNIDLDYIVGDHFVLPDDAKPYYHEKFARLPESYQPNDPTNRPKPNPVSREDVELPENAFVFASFNGNRKITAGTLDIWCNILRRAPNSVLWLMLTSGRAETNIRNYVNKRGIAADRIIFCPRVSYERHIDRQQCADLGLDTFPVNGHTTTSEQLWGGLPVLTLKGTNFASRVSESLLNAIGLPELVAPDTQAYEDMAVEMANDVRGVQRYKERLKENARTMPLFDADRFRQHLETAYEMMIDRATRGLEPDHFDVPALPPRTTPVSA